VISKTRATIQINTISIVILKSFGLHWNETLISPIQYS
jgi:hypothetical protein